MNILSLFAVLVAAALGSVAWRRHAGPTADPLNNIAILVLCSLGWWAGCDAFFFVAKTKESAWFWHRLGALGWCGFIAITAWYFILMSGLDKRMPRPVKALYWGFAAVLTLRFVAASPTAMAEDLVQSGSGLGWTLVQHYATPWPFLFLAYLVIYLGGALGYLLVWQRRERESSTRRLAIGFVLLDTLSVAVGFVSIFILPCFTSFLPPLGCVAVAIFLYGYYQKLWEYDLSSIELVLDPQSVFDSSLDAMLITDLHFNILYANDTTRALLGRSEINHTPFLEHCSQSSSDLLTSFFLTHFLQSGKKEPLQTELTLVDGAQVLASLNLVDTRRHRQTLLILTLHDISQLRQNEQRMKRMAYYDELTGLSNRRRLSELLPEWEQHALSTQTDFALLFCDLNYFKAINDRFGHDAGDAALVAVSQVLRGCLAEDDVAIRLAGDEFVLLHHLSETDSPAALSAALRSRIQGIDTGAFAPGFPLDAAVGLCLYSEYRNIHRILKAADERMYLMKQQKHRTEPLAN